MRIIIVLLMLSKRKKSEVAPAKAKPASPKKVSSETLLGSAQELLISHEGREYRLRRTQNGRLILTA